MAGLGTSRPRPLLLEGRRYGRREGCSLCAGTGVREPFQGLWSGEERPCSWCRGRGSVLIVVHARGIYKLRLDVFARKVDAPYREDPEEDEDPRAFGLNNG